MHQTQLFYPEWSNTRPLLMIQLQILVGGLHRGNPVSPEVTKFFFANNTRLKRSTKELGLVSLYLSFHETLTNTQSTNMQHDLLGTTCDLTWRWPKVKCRSTCSKSSCIFFFFFDAAWRQKHDGARIISPAFLVKLFAKITESQNDYFDICSYLMPKLLVVGQFRRHISKSSSRAVECFSGLLSISSRIMAHFRRDMKSVLLTFDGLWWPQYQP